jgi:hypothetical protein
VGSGVRFFGLVDRAFDLHASPSRKIADSSAEAIATSRTSRNPIPTTCGSLRTGPPPVRRRALAQQASSSRARQLSSDT